MGTNYLEATLETIGGGEAIIQVNHQLKEVFKNIQDPNTDPKAKRSVTLKITIKPNHTRDQADVEYETVAKFAPDAVGKDQLEFNQTGKGFVQKAEQLPLTTREDFDPESGEVIPRVGGDE